MGELETVELAVDAADLAWGIISIWFIWNGLLLVRTLPRKTWLNAEGETMGLVL